MQGTFRGVATRLPAAALLVPARARLMRRVVERRIRCDNLPRGGFLHMRGCAVKGLRDQLIADLRRECAALGPAAH